MTQFTFAPVVLVSTLLFGLSACSGGDCAEGHLQGKTVEGGSAAAAAACP